MDDFLCWWLLPVCAEAEVLRSEMEGIKVRGKNCPKPIRSWAQCGVNKKILDAMKK